MIADKLDKGILLVPSMDRLPPRLQILFEGLTDVSRVRDEPICAMVEKPSEPTLYLVVLPCDRSECETLRRFM